MIDEVKRIRIHQPKVGGRKLLIDLRAAGFTLGRDRLFDILRRNNMLVRRRKRGPSTTYSQHWLHTYTNLIKGMVLTGPHQVFVSDITYVRMKDGFCYLSLITDAWSRKIVGWDISPSLCVKGPIKALKMALKNVVHPEGLIHHSDRGIQYCCQDYIKILKDHHVLISMTEENHCYENAVAERINGILKDEYLLGINFKTKSIARTACRQAVHYYNTDRPHLSLDMKTPDDVFYAAVKKRPKCY